jgi:predicted enzyme involved in methoxymalonyl-ACP biosynthesis
LRFSKVYEQYTFIAWFGGQSDSVIRYARQKTLSGNINRYFEDRLYDLAKNHKRLFILPLETIFGKEGFDRCMDSRNFFFSRVRLSQLGMRTMASALDDVLKRIQKPAAKLLVLDCDNTLWGGVLGESGLGDS